MQEIDARFNNRKYLRTGVKAVNTLGAVLVIAAPKKPRGRVHQGHCVRPHRPRWNSAPYWRPTPMHNCA